MKVFMVVHYFGSVNFAGTISHLRLHFPHNRTPDTGCPRMFYTQKCKILRILITIKIIEFGILIYLSDRAVLLAFWRILNQGNRPNKTENTWHYVKRVIFCILIESGKRRFYELFSLTHDMLFLFICGCVLCLFWVKTNLKSYKWLKLHVWDSA